MDESTISAMLSEECSNLRATDGLESLKYLTERGYELDHVLG